MTSSFSRPTLNVGPRSFFHLSSCPILVHFFQSLQQKLLGKSPWFKKSIRKLLCHRYIFYPVLCPKLTLIQPTWSAYPYHLVFLIWYPYSLVSLIWYPYALVSLYGNTAHCSGCGVAMGCYGLKDRYCDVTMIWPLLFRGIRSDLSKTPDNALTTRMHGDYRFSIDRFFTGFNAICYTFLRNSLIYIEGRNCRLSTVPGLFNKYSGLQASDTELVAWLATSCARGLSILWWIIGFVIS